MIVWDLGGVVAAFRPERRLAALAAATRLPPNRIEAAIWGSGLDAAADRGELAESDVWERTLAACGQTIDHSTLRRCWSEAFEINRAVIALIDRRDEPAALLTDNGPILEDCFHHELEDAGKRFNPILLSWRLGATKAHENAFRRASVALQMDPASLVLVDDKQANVDTARRAGWTALRFTTPEELADQLSSWR